MLNYLFFPTVFPVVVAWSTGGRSLVIISLVRGKKMVNWFCTFSTEGEGDIIDLSPGRKIKVVQDH
jgi:hypothetical protein